MMSRLPRVLLMGLALLPAKPSLAQWPQWGGPNRSFSVDTKGLADKWPDAGPSKIWSRKLGPGFSSILAEGARLYTMYRNGGDEIAVAVNAADGKTVWERKYSAAPPKGMVAQHGRGPNASPVIAGDFIYTFGVAGHLHCLRKDNGEVVWLKDLMEELDAKPPQYGFSSTPVVYKDRLIAAVGGTGCGVVAFDLKTGNVLWKKHDFGAGGDGMYSSPIVATVQGEDQIILLNGTDVVGMDAAKGDIRWSLPHTNQTKVNVATPIWGADQILFLSSGGEGGGRGLRIVKVDGKFVVKEVWASKKMDVAITNVARSGDFGYGSTGFQGPAFLTAVNVKTGDIQWQERGFGKANVVAADGKLIILDEDGNLGLAVPSSGALDIRSKVAMFKKPARTVPTLVGQKLFVRDNEVMVALDLSADGSKK